MKKLLLKLVLTTIASLMIMQVSHAVTIDQLIPRPGDLYDTQNNVELTNKYNELKAVGNLPQVSIPEAITSIIKTILGLAMVITLVALVVMGIYYLISMGNEEDISKAKDIILYLLIGMAIMAAAYGVVAGISQFDFFKAPPA